MNGQSARHGGVTAAREYLSRGISRRGEHLSRVRRLPGMSPSVDTSRDKRLIMAGLGLGRWRTPRCQARWRNYWADRRTERSQNNEALLRARSPLRRPCLPRPGPRGRSRRRRRQSQRGSGDCGFPLTVALVGRSLAF
jgi:hypothetical protein